MPNSEQPFNQNPPEKKIFGLHRNVFYLGLVSFFNDMSNEMILSIFPAFFSSVLKAGAASLGLVEGLSDGASQIMKIFSGRYSDKVQKRKLPAILGYGLSVAIRPFYVFAGTVGSVLGLRITDRIGKGIREAPRDALISLSVDKQNLGRSFGYHRAMDTLGGIAGPLIAYFMLKKMPENFNAIFITASIIGLLAVLSFVFVKEISIIAASNKKERKPLPKSFYGPLISFFILSLGTLPVAVLLLKTKDEGLDLASIPLFYLIYSVSYSALSWKAGIASDRYGDTKILSAGYIVLIISYLVLMADNKAALIAAFVLLGFSAALTDGIQRAFVSRISDQEVRGTAIGYLNGSAGFGIIIAGVGGGFLWQAFGPPFALTAASLVVLIGLFALITQTRRT